MKNKRAVVTGGAGFLGSHLCDKLIENNIDVVCIDNLSTGSLDNISHLFGNSKFTFIDHDVTNFIHVPGDIDYVLHFASPASGAPTGRNALPEGCVRGPLRGGGNRGWGRSGDEVAL